MSATQGYFDYAATTPLDKAVFKQMEPYLKTVFGNASSIHQFGRQARAAVDSARQACANFLNTTPHNIVFTSGATESNNIVLKGLLAPGDHLITTAIEHPAILATARHLERLGVSVDYITPEPDGVISVEAIMATVTPKTKLISVMYVNNEIGTIQPIAQLGKAVSNLNKARKEKIYFHTDATQATLYCPMDVAELGVDFLSLSAHKCYGPKGVGLLYFQPNTLKEKLIDGGSQEYNIRAGTLNVAGIVGLGAALKLLTEKQTQKINRRIERLRDGCLKKIATVFPDAVFNGSSKDKVCSNIHVTLPGRDAQTAMIGLDQMGIAISAGSACAAGAVEASHVLSALGLSEEKAKQSLRISLGKYTTARDITLLTRALARLAGLKS